MNANRQIPNSDKWERWVCFVLLTAALLLTFVPLAAVPAYAATGTMNINGIQVVADLATDGNGTNWTWTASSATLTLDNTYDSYIRINCQSTNDITLVYTGDIAITGAGSAINCQGNLDVSGGGVLTLTGGSNGDGLHVEGALKISGGSVIASGGYDGVYAKNGLTVSGAASLTANATETNGKGIETYDGNIVISTTGTVSAEGKGTGFAVNAIKSGIPASGLLNISGGTVTLTNGDNPANLIFGGLSHTGGTLNGYADGAFPGGSAAIAGDLAGGYYAGNGKGASGSLTTSDHSSYAQSYGNALTIASGSFTGLPSFSGGYSYREDEHANGNSITVNGGDFSGVTEAWIYGGYSGNYAGGGEANDNTVVVTNFSGTISTVSGGNGIGGASNNTVAISGGGSVKNVYGGNGGSGNATGNVVTLTGGTFTGNIYGASAMYDATGNTVTVEAGATLDAGVTLYGGSSAMGGDAVTGNTLNLRTPITIGNVQNFEFYNFYLPAAFAAGDTMLTVSGNNMGDGAYLNDGGSGQSTVNVGIAGSASSLKKGDRVTLIDASASVAGLVGSPANNTADGSGMQGVTLKYKFALSNNSDKLYADVTEAALGEESKALSEGRAANLAALTAGGDLIAEAGMKSPFAPRHEINSYAFGAMSYNSSRYDTGSHVDGGTFSVLAGLARDRAVKGGAFTFGGFVEAGWGNYDTYNSFPTFGDVRGGGDANYYGAGLAFRMDCDGDEKGHFYNGAAVRFGRSENDYENGDLRDANGSPAKYETSSGYFGAHFTLGYLKNLKNDAKLDLYTRILWTRLNGDDTALSTGDPVSFDGADSWRWRTGLRYYASPKNGARFYAGAAYEHEFGGGVHATAYGLPIDTPSLEGGTAIGEIGFAYQKSGSPFSADFNVSGFTGQREGFGAKMDLNWEF
jgi:hypothetical protein